MFNRLFLCFLVCLIGVSVHAEESALLPMPAESGFSTDNAQLQDVLQLQYQIQLLKRLLEREKTVNDGAQAGRDIGMKKPVLSRPERDLCAAVPANIPCAQAYADLYPGFDVKPVVKEAAAPAPVAKQDEPKKKSAAPVKPAVPIDPKIFWLDVTCLEDDCSALLASNPNDPQSRRRVHAGDTIAGATVRRISASGVMLERNGRSFRASPAPRG